MWWIILVIAIILFIIFVLPFMGKRGVIFAMTASYHALSSNRRRHDPTVSEKEILFLTLQSRPTFANRPHDELMKIVEANPNIESLSRFVLAYEEKLKSMMR